MIQTSRQDRVPASNRNDITAVGILLAAVLLCWTALRLRGLPNGDMLWLTEAAGRWLRGGTMRDDFYEVNPPLAILAAVPTHLLSRVGLPLNWALVLPVLVVVALSSMASWLAMQRYPDFTLQHRAAALGGYLLSVTVLSGQAFGERDHLVTLGLVPLALIQEALTARWPRNRWVDWFICAGGAALVLLKPPFFILPVLLLAYRITRWRSVTALLQADGICLAAAFAGYMAATLYLFPDYATTILPDALHLYAPGDRWSVTGPIAAEIAAFCVGVGIVARRADFATARMAATFAVWAAACLVPFIVQGRGFFYHLIPALAFLWLAIGLALVDGLGRLRPGLGGASVAVGLLAVLTWTAARNPAHPTRGEYANLPLVRLVAGLPQPRRFFMFAPSLEMPQEIAASADAAHASRFSSFWFLPRLLYDAQFPDLPRWQHDAERRFRAMTAADLAQYKPPLLLVARFAILRGRDFRFAEWFGADPAFAAEWRHYRLSGSIEARILDYVPDTQYAADAAVPVDIYRRIDP